MLNLNEVKTMLQKLEKFYGLLGHVTYDEFLEDIYYDALKKCTIRELEAGVASCIRKNPKAYNFFPSADQILEYAKGETRFPGESSMVDLIPGRTLESVEDKMTPEEKEEAIYRGRLQAKVIVYSTGFMSFNRKEALIESMKQMSTKDLEYMTENAETGHRNVFGSSKKSASSMSSLSDLLN